MTKMGINTYLQIVQIGRECDMIKILIWLIDHIKGK